MSLIEQNKQMISRYFEEVWNQGKLEVLDELIAPNYINHSPKAPNPKPGPEGLKPIVAALRKGMPDVKYTIQDMVVSSDKVAVRLIITGTHTGDLFGIAPTGKKVAFNQFQIERIENGKIVEHWRQTDDLGMMKQLGLLPDKLT
jgi:predicted ester cyclase